MLKFYYHPLSPIARRVWLALLEKKIFFEPYLIDLKNGEQCHPNYLQLNPFHHVPVIIDDNFRLIESLAILDYLESKYPTPSLLPKSVEDMAKMKMIQMVTVNELVPKIPYLVNQTQIPLPTQITQQLDIGLNFLNEQLLDSTYFGGNCLNLADIVVGATIPLFCRLGVNLDQYKALNHWHNLIIGRETWKATNPSEKEFKQWTFYIRRLIKLTNLRRQRQFRNS